PFQAPPEHEHGVQHLACMLDEEILVHRPLSEEVLDLVVGMLSMVALEPRMPCEETDVERLEAAPLRVALPAFDELVPEAGSGPVLDSPRCGGRDRVILVTVEPDKLVAEVQRGRRAEAA